MSETIVQTIQTFITSVITPVPTPVPATVETVKKAASPPTPAPASVKVNPVLENAAKEHRVMNMHKITNTQRRVAADVAADQGLEVGENAPDIQLRP